MFVLGLYFHSLLLKFGVLARRALLVLGSRLKNEVNMHVSSVSPPCLFSLIAFEPRRIGRALLVLGSRLKNEVNVHISSVSPPCLFSLIAFEIRCIGRVLSVLGSHLENEVYDGIWTTHPNAYRERGIRMYLDNLPQRHFAPDD